MRGGGRLLLAGCPCLSLSGGHDLGVYFHLRFGFLGECCDVVGDWWVDIELFVGGVTHECVGNLHKGKKSKIGDFEGSLACTCMLC